MTTADKQYVDFLYQSLLKKVNQKEITYGSIPLTGYTDCCSVLGINNLTGTLYYKSNLGTWSPVPLGGGGSGTAIVSRETFTVSGTNVIYTIPGNHILEKIVIIPTANCNPYCGYQLGTPEDIIPQDLFTTTTPANGLIWTVDIFAVTPKAIVVSAVPNGSTVIFVKVNLS